MVTLWVFGDSFSYSFNNETPKIWQIPYIKWKGYKPKIFAELLSEKLNIPLINNAISGADNYTIYHSIIQNIDKIKPNDIVIIGVTGIESFKLYDKNGQLVSVRPHFERKESFLRANKLKDISIGSLHEMINHRDNLLYVNETNNYLKLIEHLLKDCKILKWTYYKNKWARNLNCINTKNISSIISIADETNGEVDNFHPGEEYHKALAEFFYDCITKNTIKNSKKVSII